MRILASLFHPRGTWPYSGSEIRFCALTREWKRWGVETYALEPPPFAKIDMAGGYIPLETSVGGPGLGGDFISWILKAVGQGLHASRRIRFDLIYASNNNIFNLATVVLLARCLSLPCIVVVHHLRWVYYDENLEKANTTGVDFANFLRRLRTEGLRISDSIVRVAGAYIEFKLLKQCDGFITVSRAVAVQLERLVNRDRIFVTGNGIVGRYNSLATCAKRRKNALFVGRIDEGKGVMELLNAWNQVVTLCPNAVLEVVGHGSLRRSLSEEIIRRGLTSNIHTLGFVGEEKIRVLHLQARLFFTLSHTEGFGLAIGEALAMGLPVVAWDLPPLREVFGGCQAVCLVPVGDLGKAASTAAHLLNLPEEHWHELSRKGTEYARRFSWEKAAIKELDAIRTILKVH